MEVALRAAEMILNDDIEGAEKSLESGNSAFHKLAKGVICFLQAALGFEQEVMQRASAQLADAEMSASNDHYRAQRDPRAFHSDIYDKGSEFSLCLAQSQIMSAVVGVLNESLVESVKGFYKLRKAYASLNALMEMENRFMKTRGVASLDNSRRASQESLRSVESTKSTASARVVPNGVGAYAATQPSALHNAETVDDDSDDADEFYDVDEDTNGVTKTYQGRIETETAARDFEKMSLNSNNGIEPDLPSPNAVLKVNSLKLLNHDPDSEVFSNPLDVFVHSGANFCFGLLLLMISAIPPAFGKLLYIIGFRGDRERGIRMLWQASKFHNINGGMAGLILLGWYNGLVGFCDIVPDSDPAIPDDIEGYPIARLQVLLKTMRGRYPKSQLWQLEEARMAASHRNLNVAISKLEGSPKSQLKQLEALHMFEKSLNTMFAHRYELCANSFLACIDLNSWSHALYYYIAGAAYLGVYRQLKGQAGREKEAAKAAKQAEDNFKIAPSHIGKKKIMGKQLPFDVFVNRKVQKWELRAKEMDCEFVDAVGVSPLEEMTYLWNGYKKMDTANLETSLANLDWSASQSHWVKENLDEQCIYAVLKAAALRNLRRHDEAKTLLTEQILHHQPGALKGHLHDDWPAPTAHYEMAVNIWMDRNEHKKQHGTGIVDPESNRQPITSADLKTDAKLVAECKTWVDKAKAWEKYELDARMGMKITTASDAIKKWEAKHPNLVASR